MDEPFSNVSLAAVAGIGEEAELRSGPRRSAFVEWVTHLGAVGELKGASTYQGHATCAVLTAEPSLARSMATGGVGGEAVLGLQPEALSALSSVQWTEARLEQGYSGCWLRLVASPLVLEFQGKQEAYLEEQSGDLHLMVPLLTAAVRHIPWRAKALSLRRIAIAADGSVTGVGSKARRTMPLSISADLQRITSS